MSDSLYARRRMTDTVVQGFAYGSTAVGVFFLAQILFTLLYNGFASLDLNMFTMSTPGPGSVGGLLNAIYGSVLITLLATLIGTPAGILAGTFLAEYGKGSKFAEVVRFVNDILLSSPSIIIGLFVYTVVVLRTGHFSAWSGAVALAIIFIPVVVRTSEDMLNLVPNALREAASALGAEKWRVIVTISYRAARQGIITGIILAIARISGETAPLIFTAFGNLQWSTSLDDPMATLPAVIYNFARSPYEDWIRLAWGGALLITITILILNISARILSSGSKR